MCLPPPAPPPPIISGPIPSRISSGLPLGYDCDKVPVGPVSPMISRSEPVFELPVDAVPEPSKSSMFYSAGFVDGTVTFSMSSKSIFPLKYSS